MKKTFELFIALLVFSSIIVSCTDSVSVFPEVAAHRGCWLEGKIPENSLAGVRMASRFGYPAIECDVKYTSDSVMVLMHDNTINRTMRNASDYSVIEEPVYVKTTSFKDLREKYVFASDIPEQRVQIPTLEDLLTECAGYGVTPMLHSSLPESYELAQKIMGDNWICFMSKDELAMGAREFSNCLVLLDPGRDPAERTVGRLTAIGGKCGMSSMKYDMVDKEYISTVRAAGFDVQSSIWPTPFEERAIFDGASIILSDFCWLQSEGRKAFDGWKLRKKELKSGESVEYTCDRTPEYAAFTIELELEGTVEAVVNGTRTYTLESGKHVMGFRMTDTCPSFVLTACKDSRIIKATIKTYEI